MPEQQNQLEQPDNDETLLNADDDNADAFGVETEEGRQLLEVELDRNSDDGLVLYVKVADEIEQLFSSEDIDQSSHWSADEDHEYYKKNYTTDFSNHMGSRKDYYGEEYVSSSNDINLAILRTVGISDGLEFHLGFQYSEETMVESIEDLKREVAQLYNKFLTPVRVTTEMTVQEVL